MVSNIAALIRVVGFNVPERGRVEFQGERESARESQREKRDEVPAEVRLATEEGSSNIGEKCECRWILRFLSHE